MYFSFGENWIILGEINPLFWDFKLWKNEFWQKIMI